MSVLFKLLLVVALLIAAIALSRNALGQISKFKEIAAVERQASLLADKNESLKREEAQARSPLYREREARESLGYQKPGETLYVVDMSGLESRDEEEAQSSNWRAWYTLFFH